MSERELHGRRVDLDGAIDMHVHFGPEPFVSRLSQATFSVDPAAAARDAAAAGMAAIVLKPHEFGSAVAAHLAQAAAPSVTVLSGICCDYPVGGLNPAAVETALRAGGKVVWLPTISSRQSDPAQLAMLFGDLPGIAVIDDEGKLVEPARVIMELVREYDAVLATGHITRAEHVAVARDFGRRGRLLVTHAMQRVFGPELTPAHCVELADLGAMIEFSAHTCAGIPAGATTIAAAIRTVGSSRVILSSDFGWTPPEPRLPRPAAGLQRYIDGLWEAGATEQELRRMACANPARLLGLAG